MKNFFSCFHQKKSCRQGSILIFALWVLSFLSLLSALVGLTIRQRVSLISRIEDRSQLRFMNAGAVKKAISVLRRDIQQNNAVYTAVGKSFRHNNPKDFKNILFSKGFAEVSYAGTDQSDRNTIFYGMSDEEGRLNINSANRFELMRLIAEVAVSRPEEAQALADRIVDWRQFGHSEPLTSGVEDFQGYEEKDKNFETLDELLLISGMSQAIYDRLIPFVTVFGDGVININTAPQKVLYALGLEESVAQKIVQLRFGSDGIEATGDDHIFAKAFDVASEVLSVTELSVEEIKQIDELNKQRKIKTNSLNYRIISTAHLDYKNLTQTVICIYNFPLQRIIYWKEK